MESLCHQRQERSWNNLETITNYKDPGGPRNVGLQYLNGNWLGGDEIKYDSNGASCIQVDSARM